MTFRPVALGILMALAVPANAEQPPGRPVVPPLRVGGKESPSFMISGVVRISDEGGLAFQFATDGEKQFFVLYDPTNGTPIFLSDGLQTLVYDIGKSRIVRVPGSRGYVTLDYTADAEKPMAFSVGVAFETKAKKLEGANSFVRLDRFVENEIERMHVESGPDGPSRYSVSRQDGTVSIIEQEAGEVSAFRYIVQKPDRRLDFMELEAHAIGGKLPADAMAFPDLKKLSAGVRVVELSGDAIPTFVTMLTDGRLWLIKLALSGDPDQVESIRKLLPDADLEALRKQDIELGTKYRDALAEQGIRFPTHPMKEAGQAQE